jgi:hypothetical protein
MDAATVRARAQRCRDLLRVAVSDEVRAQLRHWAEEFDAEAEAIEKSQTLSSSLTSANGAG